MKVTISEVAKKAGVSKTTVSRILNGNYAQTTEETKQRILKVIEELDYRPNALAKGLKSMKTNVIGIVLSNLKNPFWASVLEGVEDTAHHLGYNLMICNSNEDPKLEKDHITALRMQRLDGIMINATMRNQELFSSLVKEKYPLVAINRKVPELNIETVAMDNIKGSKLAVEHLIKQGKERIAVIVYPTDGISSRKERVDGYIQTLEQHGVFVDHSLIKEIEENKGNAKNTVKDLLLGKNPPDAVFSTNNTMSLEIIEGIHEAGRRVPDDIALIGYDETVWSKHLNPPLSTVKQPAYAMGEIAAQRLIKIIELKRKPKAKTTLLDPHLIIRRSCGMNEEAKN